MIQEGRIYSILKELFRKPDYKFHIRELARITKLNPNTIINLTNRLEKESCNQGDKKTYC